MGGSLDACSVGSEFFIIAIHISGANSRASMLLLMNSLRLLGRRICKHL